ncbi:terpene synthase-like isoform X2 [Paramacrobiotus metropolitanus]|uniref:terpene synthase-like isoform X2 n=1 Tax=Paramacrobiotus metropolitanus TaxID=2943436 RepID=UPI0024463673|nr:terpene synthase-like isoform X2 [Paramacrobiotus metropolitanus]
MEAQNGMEGKPKTPQRDCVGINGCAGDGSENDSVLLQPFHYIQKVPGKQIRGKLAQAFNIWMKISNDKLQVITELMDMLHNASLLIDDIEDSSTLRRGVPVAHLIYGIPSTINAANYVYFLALERALSLQHPDAPQIFSQQLLDLHRGQGMEIYWRDSYQCPSEDQYRTMVIQKTGGLFMLAVRLMQLFSADQTTDFRPLTETLGLLFQIRDDYCNLIDQSYSHNKTYCEDFTEGKFSFPIVHAVRVRNDPDGLVMSVLRRRTLDVDVKKRCVQQMCELGSLEYTRQTLLKLDKQMSKNYLTFL